MTKDKALKKISDFFEENSEDFEKSGLAYFMVACDWESEHVTSFAAGTLKDVSTAIAYMMVRRKEIGVTIASAIEVVDNMRKNNELQD